MKRIWFGIAAWAGIAACAACVGPALAQDCDPLTDIHCHRHFHHHFQQDGGPIPASPPARPAHSAARPARSAALVPVREYLRAADIPPAGVGAYGIVAFKAKATPATRAKLEMVCQSFVAHFPPNATIPATVPLSDRMFTIWPLDDPASAKAAADDCEFVVDHYDLYAAEAAIGDAKLQNAEFNGEGPFLIGWSPSNTRGAPDALVLIVDISADNTQERIDHDFSFWKDKIVEDPSLWRSGFSVERFRVALHDFADQYGSEVLDAIKLVGMKP